MYGFYKRPDEEQPVVLLANEDDRARYEAKGLEFLGEAPPPGHATAEEVAAALKRAKAKR